MVRDGRVIAERYANGIGIDTQLIGFSMTKSVVNALLGIMTEQGLLSPSIPAPIPEWRGATDPRREIEVLHLMRMTRALRSTRPIPVSIRRARCISIAIWPALPSTRR